jgi:hypothetical protein
MLDDVLFCKGLLWPKMTTDICTVEQIKKYIKNMLLNQPIRGWLLHQNFGTVFLFSLYWTSKNIAFAVTLGGIMD